MLILPDEEEPLCRIYVEAKDIVGAEALSREVVKRIEYITELQKAEMS